MVLSINMNTYESSITIVSQKKDGSVEEFHSKISSPTRTDFC
jgi:hypothetical protein